MTVSEPGLLVLHAVRTRGVADAAAVARRYGLDRDQAAELLEDFRAFGWVGWHQFGGVAGYSLTESGRVENERRLDAELDAAGCRTELEAAYPYFLVLNARAMHAFTDWQIRPEPHDRSAPNDHTDPDWDQRVVETLVGLGLALVDYNQRLTALLDRFSGYDDRYHHALERATSGALDWVWSPSRDSCHTVWMQLHEDLIATLGRSRAEDG